MELRLVRRRRPPVVRGLVPAAGVLVGWLLLVAVVPLVLGLHLNVVTHDGQSHPAGTVAVTRHVPVSELRIGDQLSVGGHLQSVVGAAPGVLVVDDLATPAGSVRLVTADHPTLSRVALTVPYAGLPLSGPGGLVRSVLAGALVGLTCVAWQLRRDRQPGPLGASPGRGASQTASCTAADA